MTQSKDRVHQQLPANISRLANLWIGVLLRMAERISAGQLSMVLPDGTSRVFSGICTPGPRAVLEVKHPRAVRRLLFGGANGFAEAYMNGDWDTPDLRA